MRQRWTLQLGPNRPLNRPTPRYAVIERAGRCLARREAQLLAWGFGPDGVRMVVGGERRELALAKKGLLCGTLRALQADHPLLRAQVIRAPAPDLHQAVVWAHLAPPEIGPQGPLSSPWSSHRDLLGLREARFFDGRPLRAQLDAARVHADCGGGPLPHGAPPPPGDPEDLGLLLRISAAILGVLPADRRCFRLFVHLARARGWGARCLARALTLSPRRIRQLASSPEPRLPLALTTLADPRLAVVP